MKKYLNEYIAVVKKYDSGNILSNKEMNILRFASLNAFYDKVEILKGKEKIELEYIYKKE